MYATYRRDHAALCATVIRYRAQGAVREIGKTLGDPDDITGELAKLIRAWDEEGVSECQVAELNLNGTGRRLRMTLDLARHLIGVLPKSFHRIRHDGLLASATRQANLARARELLAPMPTTPPPRSAALLRTAR